MGEVHQDAIHAELDRKLVEAREQGRRHRKTVEERSGRHMKSWVPGETEVGSAGAQRA